MRCICQNLPLLKNLIHFVYTVFSYDVTILFYFPAIYNTKYVPFLLVFLLVGVKTMCIVYKQTL